MKWLSTKALALLAVAVWGVLLAILHFQKVERERPAKEATQEQSAVIETAQALVKGRLTDPESAQFTEIRVLGESVDQRVCGLVNAKNKFGGYHGPERFLVMMGSAYIGEERPGPAIWNKPGSPCGTF